MIKSSVLCLNIILLASIVFAEVPSYMHVCGSRNPDLDACVIRSVESLKSKLKEGIPELDVPPIEPFTLPDGLPLARGEGLLARAKNVKLWNVPSFNVKSFHADLERKQFDFLIHFDMMKVQGDYEVDAKILVPIHGVGSIEIETYGIDANINMKYNLINTKKGQQLYFPTMTCKLKIDDYKSKFTATDKASAPVSDAINAVINTNRKEILDSIIPILEEAISKKALGIANRICKNFTYDELFPDRE